MVPRTVGREGPMPWGPGVHPPAYHQPLALESGRLVDVLYSQLLEPVFAVIGSSVRSLAGKNCHACELWKLYRWNTSVCYADKYKTMRCKRMIA